MKIAFLMQESRMGGIEYNALHLAGRLDASAFRVEFLCPEEGKLTEHLKKLKIPFRYYRRGRLFSTSIRIGSRHIFNPLGTLYDFFLILFVAAGLARLVRTNGYELVVTKGLLANFYGGLAARMARVPCVWDMQEIVSADKFFGLPRRFLDGCAAALARSVIAPAPGVRDQFSESVRRKTALVPNGVDWALLRPERDGKKVRGEWGVAENEFLVAHIARFTRWKGQHVVVKAAAVASGRLKNVRFALVGSPVFENDDYEKEIKAMAAGSPAADKIFFTGFRDDLEDVLAAADIYVHASVEPEGCPITLLTAMAMAKPVIATDVAGNNEIVTDRSDGILIKPESHEEMAAAIELLERDPGLRQRLGKQARAKIQAVFSLEAYAKASEKIFSEAV